MSVLVKPTAIYRKLKDQPLLSSKRRPHLKIHKWFRNEQIFGNGFYWVQNEE
jgi:hypothetical protein